MFIRCPTCGDRASVYHCGGDRYKFSCGFCGDEGFLRISNWEEPKTAYERVEEKFQSLDEHLRRLFPGKQGEELSHRMLEHCLSKIFTPIGNQTEENLAGLKKFCQEHPGYSAERILSAARQGEALFREQFQIERDAIGSFWTEQISQMEWQPPEGMLPDALRDFLNEMDILRYGFWDTDCNPWEDSEALLETCWRAYAYRHIPRQRVADTIREDPEEWYWALMCLILADFPELFQWFSAEEFSEMDVLDLLEEVAERDQTLSLRMWRDVLETAKACLQDAETGAELMDWITSYVLMREWKDELIELLEKEEELARLLFQESGAVDFQEDVLRMCGAKRNFRLGERLLKLLKENSVLGEERGEVVERCWKAFQSPLKVSERKQLSPP